MHKKPFSFFLIVFLIVSLVITSSVTEEVKAQEEKVFGNPTLPDWVNVTVTEYSANIIVDNGDGFVWEFSKDKDKFNQIYENDTLIVKDEQWLLIGEDLKEDSYPIGKLEWEQPKPYRVVVKDSYQDIKKNNNFTVIYNFHAGFLPKITFNTSIGTEGNYTVDWRCWVHKLNAISEPEKHRVKFWDANETGVVFDYEDVYMSFGNITELDVTGWFKGKRFDEKFNVGFLNGTFILDPTFGDENGVAEHVYDIKDTIVGTAFSCPEIGTTIRISAYCYVTNGDHNLMAMLHKKSDKSLVGSGSAVIAGDGAYNWRDIPVVCSVIATDYYLTVVAEADTVYLCAAADVALNSAIQSWAYGYCPPDPLVTGDWPDIRHIHCDYTAEEEGVTKYLNGSITQQYGINHLNDWTFNRYMTANPLFTIASEKAMSFNRYGQINPLFSINHLNDWTFNLFSLISPIFQINHLNAWAFNRYGQINQVFTVESTVMIGVFLNLWGSIIHQWTINNARATAFRIYGTVNPVFGVWGTSNLVPTIEVTTFGTPALVIAIIALAIAVTALTAKKRS